MKSPALSLLALLPLTLAQAANPAPHLEGDRPTLTIKKTVDPIMPHKLSEVGIQEGEVRVVIAVDSTGKLSEWLIVGYTHPGLADAVIAALKQWEFDAPRWHGEPVSVQREVKFNFETHGTVVSVAAVDAVENYLVQRFPERYVFRPCTLKELDRIPTPLEAKKPEFAKRTAAQGVADVTVEFFIDETGVVRMPSLVEGDDPELAASSVAAVRQWRFEPPTRQGRRVLVRVQQTFHFQP